jgi:RNA polymerase sigma-70 factor, ECF subfamily
VLEESVSGDSALDRLFPVVYDQLKRLAAAQLARERGRNVLQTTALVHEAYLKLVDDTRVTRKGRSYFFAAAGRAMRQILVDQARRRRALKRGGGIEESLDENVAGVEAFAEDLLDLHAALNRLAGQSPRQARVVECRYFGGLSVQETAAALDLSERTVKYDWAMARAWLYRELKGSGDGS